MILFYHKDLRLYSCYILLDVVFFIAARNIHISAAALRDPINATIIIFLFAETLAFFPVFLYTAFHIMAKCNNVLECVTENTCKMLTRLNDKFCPKIVAAIDNDHVVFRTLLLDKLMLC